MDYFYDGQVRRYVTQFMRVFIGFKYKTGGDTPEERHVPVMYGDMTRQVAALIKENSENKLPTVPRIACYITGLEMDTSRLSDAQFISKVNIHERDYSEFDEQGNPIYQQSQGGSYTVERLMPTPYKLSLKADIWTSNTDQKLQLLEQILVLFNPSLEIQTTDNYIDWTSLSVLDIKNLQFSSRTIPAGAESDIDICSIEFETPIWITPPAKVKRLGVVKSLVMNMFTDQGIVKSLDDLIYNDMGNVGAQFNSPTPGAVSGKVNFGQRSTGYGVLLLKNPSGQGYDLSIIDVNEAVKALGLEAPQKLGSRIDWRLVFEKIGPYSSTSLVRFRQPNGYEVVGTFELNEIDPTYLIVNLDQDTIPSNTIPAITAIIDPYKFNPLENFGGYANIPVGTAYLMLDDVNDSKNVGQFLDSRKWVANDSSANAYDGPDAWKNLNGDDPVIKANTIIEWNGVAWVTKFDPTNAPVPQYFTNLRTGIQYKWDGTQWLKSFEGEYAPGYWTFNLNA